MRGYGALEDFLVRQLRSREDWALLPMHTRSNLFHSDLRPTPDWLLRKGSECDGLRAWCTGQAVNAAPDLRGSNRICNP